MDRRSSSRNLQLNQSRAAGERHVVNPNQHRRVETGPNGQPSGGAQTPDGRPQRAAPPPYIPPGA